MRTMLHSRNPVLIFAVTLLLLFGLALIPNLPAFTTNADSLSIGITLDLLLIVPLIYFLWIRITTIPKTSVLPLIIIGLLLGYAILPKEHQGYLNLFKTFGLPIIEVTVVGYIAYKVRKALISFKKSKDHGSDFYTVLKGTCQDILPKFAVYPVATEIAVFYYGWIHWKTKKIRANEFSNHQKSGIVSLLIAIILIVAVETVVLHMVIVKWSVLIAWILTCLSIYTGFQLFGFAKSITKRPVKIENDIVFFRQGIMSETQVNITDIERIEISSKEIEISDKVQKLSVLGQLESHNTIITCKVDQTWRGLYGFKKSYRTLLLHLDHPQEFKSHIDQLLSN